MKVEEVKGPMTTTEPETAINRESVAEQGEEKEE